MFLVYIKWLCSYLYCKIYKYINTCFLIEGVAALYYNILTIFGDKIHLEWKTHWQSPVCRDILKRKFYIAQSKSAFSISICYFIFAVLLFIDMKSSYIMHWLGPYVHVGWYIEFISFLIATLHATLAFMIYVSSLFSKPMEISLAHKKLFRIDDNSPGFIVKEKDDSTVLSPKQEHFRFSSWHDSIDSSPSALSITPLDYSAKSWANLSDSNVLDTTSSSWTFQQASPMGNYMSTPKSITSHNSRNFFHLDNETSPFSRKIKSKQQLEEYLKEYGKEEMKSLSLEESKSLLSNVSALDNSPLSSLRKCRYQQACKMPNSTVTSDDSLESNFTNVCYKLKISDKILTVWSERLRKWICQTIFVKLVDEIESINATLSQMGLPEFQVGTVSLFALHQIALTKVQHLPTLAAVLPYLDMHLNQEYLVRRLKDLARGGCMGDFKWNSGGNYDEKQWCDDLPTDSAIVMHFLCCYLDAHMPPEPHCPEGKPFSSKYFKKVPEKPLLSKDTHYIYQSSTNPPHFKVVLGQDIYSLPKGRNNLFCAILIFLNYLKTKECGMLGRVNLGPSGLNILWVID